MNSQKIAKQQAGVVLLEGMIAIAIFAFGVLAVVGMQASTARAASDAKYRVDASFLVNQAIGEIWLDRANALAADGKSDDVAILPKGKRAIKVTAVNKDNKAPYDVTVTVTWQLPGESKSHTHSSITRING